MDVRLPSILLICCIFMCLQLITGETIREAIKVYQNENKVLKKNLQGSTSHIVYAKFYDLNKKKRNSVSEGYVLTLVLKEINITYFIELQLNEELVEVPVHTDDNVLESDVNDSPCHFHGRIISKPTGFAAISACSKDNKMTGILMIQGRIYFLRPSSRIGQKNKENEHYLHEYWDENSEFCGINNVKRSNLGQGKVFRNDILLDTDVNRVKRETLSSNRKVIEVAIFVDNDLYKRIETTTSIDPRRATVRRVLGIMNQVQLIYNYSSLQTKFKIVVMKLQILKSNQTAPNTENGDIDKYLDNFCVWQSKMNEKEGDDNHWDHAIMLTGRDLYKNTRGRRNTKVLGLAWINGMCRTNYSCTLNEGTSFEAAFVIAHEIAHNLGVMHDGSGNNCDRTKYIMSDKTGPGKVHWSACSNVYIRNFFNNGNGKCLSDDASPPNRSFDLDSISLPGIRYSLSDQCILALGSGYSPHKSNKEPFNNVCRELWCASGSWAKPAHPALEGSPCGEGKICLEGKCRSSALRRNSLVLQSSNSSSKDITENTGRKVVSSNNGSILKKIQETVMKAIRNLG